MTLPCRQELNGGTQELHPNFAVFPTYSIILRKRPKVLP